LSDGRVYVDLTGIVLVNLTGGSDWIRKTLKVGVRGGKVESLLQLPPPQQGRHWEVPPTMWSVSASPVAIFNRNTAVNAGWAVNTCNTEWDLGSPASEGDLLSEFQLFMDLAVRDTDGSLLRVNYDFRAVGNPRQVQDIFVE
jgi:hypothetical protein